MKRARFLLAAVLLAGVIGGGIVLSPAGAAPAEAAIVGPYPHPQFPNIDVYMDKDGIFFARTNATGQTDVLKRTGAAALNQAQSVPGGYYNRLVQSAKAGTATAVNSVNKVLTVAGSSRYSAGAVLAKSGKLVGAAPTVVANAVKTAPKVLATATGGLLRVAGPASVGLVGYQVGVMAGNNVVDLLGIDGDGVVCRSDGAAFYSFVTMRDCNAWQAEQDFIANYGITEGISGGVSCSTGSPEICVRLIGAYSRKNSQMRDITSYCFSQTVAGSRFAGSTGMEYQNQNGVWKLSAGNSSTLFWQGTNMQIWCEGYGSADGAFSNAHTGGPTPSAERLVAYRALPGGVAMAAIIADTNPDRVLTCTVTGTDGNTYSAESATFKETDETFAVPECPTLPEGVFPANVGLTEDGGGESHVLYDEPTAPEYQEFATQYPECMDGSCLLDLRTAGASCFEGLSDCADWITDPERETEYQCRYGTHDVPLSQCFIYGQLFKPGVAESGAPWADPETGAVVGGAQTGPQGGPVMQNGVAGSDVPRDCWPSGWAVLNPVEWVLRPVQCALEWAFVPNPITVATKVQSVQAAWGQFPLVALADWYNGFVAALPADSSCGGIPVDIDISFTMWPFNVPAGVEVHETILAACDEPLASIAATGRAIQGFALLIVTVIVISRYAGISIGFTGVGKS